MITAPLPVFYSFRRCPYAMRARLAIVSASLAVELREVVLRDKPQAMLDASPKATVPVMVLEDGTVIDESLEVMRYALEQADPENWLPRNAQEHRAMQQLIEVNDGHFKHALDRYKYPNRYAREMIDPVDQRAIATGHIERLEEPLSKHGWLVGERPTLADFALLPFVRQFAHVDRDWFDAQPWPGVIAWLDRFLASGWFAAIMGKHAPWKPGDTSVPFPAGAAQSDL